jgi:MraZ protein
MFQGATQLNLDAKGRLAIPARYRDALLASCCGNLVLTTGMDGCLLLYPQLEWQPVRDNLLKLPMRDPRSRALQRFIVGNAEDVSMDGAGRVLVSATLRKHAVLEKQVMLVGQGSKFELWDEVKWYEQQDIALAFMEGELPPELEGFSL